MSNQSPILKELEGSQGSMLPVDSPTRIGEYELLEPLGRGGMGLVFKARHMRLKRMAAIKFVRPDLVKQEVLVRRFLREVETLGQFDHPNVLRAYDAGEWEGRCYLAMEFVDGCSSLDLLDGNKRLAIVAACQIIHDAALGLQHIHEHEIIHRDVKPSNILISRSGQVKIGDLGLARKDWDDSLALTNSEDIVGTVDYLAPEMLDDATELDTRVDLYSLGCTFYYLLTGFPPFHGNKYSSLLKKIRGHGQDAPPAIRTLRPEIPEELAAVIASAMQKQPQHRYQTAAEFAAALAPFCQTKVSLGSLVPVDSKKPASASQSLTATKTIAKAGTHPESMLVTARKNSRWLLAFSAVGVVSLLAMVGWVAKEIFKELPPEKQTAEKLVAEESETHAMELEPIVQRLSPAQIEYGKSYSLLNIEPVKEIWPLSTFNKTSKLAWDQKQKNVNVQTYGCALLRLGVIPPDKKDFVLKLKLNQTAWGHGQIGVFFGFDKLRPGWEACRLIQINSSGKKDRRLAISFNEMEIERIAGKITNTSETGLSLGAAVNEPNFAQEANLEILVLSGRPVNVTWNGAQLEELLKLPTGSETITNRSCTGIFGFYAEETSVDLLEAQLQFIGE